MKSSKRTKLLQDDKKGNRQEGQKRNEFKVDIREETNNMVVPEKNAGEPVHEGG